MKQLFFAIFLLMFSSVVLSEETPESCRYFYRELVRIPHQKIAFDENILVSDVDGKNFPGCRIILNSHIELMKENAELPSFWADEGSTLYNEGWRTNHDYTADGPGSGKYAIEKDGITCIIDWDQHAWIDEKTDKIMQSDKINMEIRCLDKN